MFPVSTSWPKRVGPRGQSKLVAKATGAGLFLAGAPIISAHEVAQKILPYDPESESVDSTAKEEFNYIGEAAGDCRKVAKRIVETVLIVKHILVVTDAPGIALGLASVAVTVPTALADIPWKYTKGLVGGVRKSF